MSGKQENQKGIPVEQAKINRCIGWLTISLGLGLFYALALAFFISLNLAMPDLNLPELVRSMLILVWALGKIGFAFALICLYQATGYTKWAIAALLLAASAVMPYVLTNPDSQIFVIGIEALAITALSLSLFDIGKASQSDLGVAAGMIFMGVILQILQNALMAYVGIAFLAMGFYLSLKRLWVQPKKAK